MDDIRELRKDALTQLHKVKEQLYIKDGGIKQKLRVKSKQLKKGKEKTLNGYKLILKQSETKANNDIIELQNKIAALETKIDAIRNRAEGIATDFNTKILDLYESEDELTEEDLTLPISYHEKMALKESLERRVANFDLILNKEEADRKAKLLAEFQAHKAKEEAARKALEPKPEPLPMKPKKVIKLKKEPEALDLEAFAQKRIAERYTEWSERERRIIKCMEPVPSPSDPFWQDYKEVHTPNELAILDGYGSLLDRLTMKRQHILDEANDLKNAEPYDT